MKANRPKFLDKNSRVQNRHQIKEDTIAGIMVYFRGEIMTKKEALDQSIDLWSFLADTGQLKTDWEKYESIMKFTNKCPLCQVFMVKMGKDYYCGDCPLKCHQEDTYKNWNMAKYQDDRKKYAKKILFLILEYKESLKVCLYCGSELPKKNRAIVFCDEKCGGAWKFMNPNVSYGISPVEAEAIMSRQDYINRAIEGDIDAMDYLRRTFRLKSIYDPKSKREIRLKRRAYHESQPGV